MSKKDPTAPRPNPAPVNLTIAQSRKLKQLLANGPLTSAALKAAGLTEDALRQAGFKGVINAQNLTLWMAGKSVDHESRITQLEDKLGTGTLEKALKAGSAGGVKSFVQYLRDAKATDGDIKEALGIFTDRDLDELNDGQVFAEFVTNLQAITRSMREQLSGHETDITNLKGEVTTVSSRVTINETAIKSLKGQVTNSRRLPVWAWLVAAVVGIVAGFIWSSVDFSRQVTATANDVTIHMTVTSVADATWVAWLFGLAIGLAVLGVIGLVIGGRKTKIKSKSESSRTESTESASAVSTGSTTPAAQPPVRRTTRIVEDGPQTYVIRPVPSGTSPNA